jgi:hypothetical protein
MVLRRLLSSLMFELSFYRLSVVHALKIIRNQTFLLPPHAVSPPNKRPTLIFLRRRRRNTLLLSRPWRTTRLTWSHCCHEVSSFAIALKRRTPLSGCTLSSAPPSDASTRMWPSPCLTWRSPRSVTLMSPTPSMASW